MGEIINRAARIIKRRVFPTREPRPFSPTSDQLNEARATLDELRRIGAVSDFAATGIGQIIDKAKVSHPGIDVEALRRIGSDRIENVHRIVTSPVQDANLEINDRGELEYALDTAKRAEEQNSRSGERVRELQINEGDSFLDRKVSRRAASLAILLAVGGAGGANYLYQVSSRSNEGLSEKDIWRRVLGAEVEIKPQPALLTPKVKKNLEAFGLNLMYLPQLHLGTKGADIHALGGVHNYLSELQRRYPNWRTYEDVHFYDEYLNNFSGNLSRNYWNSLVGIGYHYPFPQLPGQWIAVEKVKRPKLGTPYEKTPISQRLGFDNRFGVGINSIKIAMEREKVQIVKDLGLESGVEIRMPRAVEYNLIFNREWWGSDSREWTDEGLVIGGSKYPYGASEVSHAHPSGWSNVGFRVAAFFDS